ncbi:MAG: AAA family ATPase [Gemmatimonadetes bacterium]|nr:AAA family ATPase [Gemmatimonadota bacterium]
MAQPEPVYVMSLEEFGGLPGEYLHLLRLGEERHGLDVVPLRALTGGRTGAFLYLVSASAGDLRQLDHFVLKLDKVNSKSRATEIERHRLAMSQAPTSFAQAHMPELAFEVSHEGSVALFYTVAGHSLQRFRTLASVEGQSQMETLFAATCDRLLRDWNSDAAFERAVHPKEVLEKWLGYRLSRDGNIASLLEDTFHVSPDIEGFLIEGQVFPNPLSFGLDAARWEGARAIDVLVGHQHGDLNIGNILAEFAPEGDSLNGFFLIDFALYKGGMPLMYDLSYLEMSYLTRELERTSLDKWVRFVDHFSRRDLPEPGSVPVEMAGTCSVLSAGRASLGRWVSEAHPSLSDDLWGQYWLGAVAAGLNFCNKKALSTEERLAGLIYAAVHLKRYCVQFGVPLPTDVRLLYDAGRWGSRRPRHTTAAAGAERKPLPVAPTAFIGREADVKAVTGLLAEEDVRLVALTGPGGTGKTRLALQVAAEVQGDFKDGVLFVDLAPIMEPEAVLPAVARELGVREASERPLLEEIEAHVQARSVLLVLDNFEQVTAAAPGMAQLLRGCPGLKLLVTSREAMHMRGERVYRVLPLALPDAGLKDPSVEELARFDAIRLFLERARAVKPDFELTSKNAHVVAEICARLDGLPLAIELATARLNVLSPHGILERLASRLELLRRGARDLPARQQTLRDTVGWSHDLLDAGERRLFALLSVFPSCTFEAAEAVAMSIERLDEMDLDVLDGLDSLVGKSLIQRADRPDGRARLTMLETIREYAAERLEDDPDLATAARRAHATYYADLARREWERLAGHEQEAVPGELESDFENLRLAWRHWVMQGDLEQLGNLTDCLWLLYDRRGWYQGTVDLTTDLLGVLSSTPSTPERAEQEILLLTSLVRALLAVKGYTPEVEHAYTRALELCEAQGEVPQLYPVLRGLSSYYTYRAEFDKGARTGQQITDLADRLGDASMRGDGLMISGYCRAFMGDLHAGLELLEQSLGDRAPGERPGRRFRFGTYPRVTALTACGLVTWLLGFPDRALEWTEQAMAVANDLGHPFSMAYARFHAGLLRLWRREAEIARAHAQAVLQISDEHEFRIWEAVGTCLHGAALAGVGQAEDGLADIQRGLAKYQGLKSRPPVFWPMLLSMHVGVCGQTGRGAEGLRLLDEATEAGGTNPGNVLASDLHRLRGELLLDISPERADEAESWLRQGLEVARGGDAALLELRAATTLSRLYQRQNRRDEARTVLATAHAKMTEGFETADVREAEALLEELT